MHRFASRAEKMVREYQEESPGCMCVAWFEEIWREYKWYTNDGYDGGDKSAIRAKGITGIKNKEVCYSKQVGRIRAATQYYATMDVFCL